MIVKRGYKMKALFIKERLDYVKAHDFIDWYKSYKLAIFDMKNVNKFIGGDDVRFNVILS